MDEHELEVELAGIMRGIEKADAGLANGEVNADTYDARTLLLGVLARLDCIRTDLRVGNWPPR